MHHPRLKLSGGIPAVAFRPRFFLRAFSTLILASFAMACFPGTMARGELVSALSSIPASAITAQTTPAEGAPGKSSEPAVQTDGGVTPGVLSLNEIRAGSFSAVSRPDGSFSPEGDPELGDGKRPSSVPEPAACAVILGVAGLGATMLRRRSTR